MPLSKRLAVIGDPISHSLSPLIHNAAIKNLKLPFRYEAIRVRPHDLKRFIKTKAKSLVGFNLTIPHKEAILPYLDYIVPKARLMAAVNTVWNHEGKLIGFNTDGDGYLASLQEKTDFVPNKKNIVILGAGGAARGLAVALSLAGAAKITLANRTVPRAQRLVLDLKKISPGQLQACPLIGSSFQQALKTAALVINTTSIGLGGTQFKEFPWNKLKKKALVSDIVYSPRITPFLKAARRHGHSIHTGEGMLVHQGALAFEIWTGVRPNVKLMSRVLHQRI